MELNAAHVHLLLNHLPVLGSIFGTILLAWAVWRRKDESTRVALVVLTLVALASIGTYLSGEPAEEIVERLDGFSDPVMESHEEAALPANIAAIVLGLSALGGVILYRARPVARRYSMVVLVLAVVTAALMSWTALLGGQVRHTEVRPADAAVVAPAYDDD